MLEHSEIDTVSDDEFASSGVHTKPLRKVLCIYTGGTIGMKPTARGYVPAPSYLNTLVRTLPMFHDEEARCLIPASLYTSKRGLGVPMITPEDDHGERCCFRFLNYDPLLDSSDMNYTHWARIASDIVNFYDSFDSFLILHGTDTMAYTATALSFFLSNLRKTVVVTGSQIPLCRPRNDGLMNLLGSLDVAGHLDIPEVVIYFNNKIFRGNRCSKVDANSMNAFDSPNHLPLGTIEVNTKVEWHMLRNKPVGKIVLNTHFCEDITMIRIFPGKFRNFRDTIAGTLKGLVLQTFGAGNCPEDPVFLKTLTDITERGCVVVNVTQCIRGEVEAHYAAGQILVDAGVISAGDMTPEAALVKLGWLLAQPNSTPAEVRELFQQDLRGEVTVRSKDSKQFSLENDIFAKAVYSTLAASGALTGREGGIALTEIGNAIVPTLVCQFASTNNITELDRIFGGGEDKSVSPNIKDYDGRTALHLAAAKNHVAAIKYLLGKKADVNSIDNFGRTPLREAIEHFGQPLRNGCCRVTPITANLEMNDAAVAPDSTPSKDVSTVDLLSPGKDISAIDLLLSYGAETGMTDLEAASIVCNLVAEGSNEGSVMGWLAGGFDVNTGDYDKRTPLHIAAAFGNISMSKLLLANSADVYIRDRFGATPLDDAQREGHEEMTAFLELCISRAKSKR